MTDTANETGQKSVSIPPLLGFLLELEELKRIERQNPLSSGERRETVAEHSWHLALATILLQDEVDVPFDTGYAVQLAVLHDVVEAFVGDTFAFGDTSGQHKREHDAMQELRARTDLKSIHRLVDLWEQYERQESVEARFVKGLDALLPIAQNYHNPEHSSWLRHGVSAEKVFARLNNHGEMGTLRAVGEEMITSAKEQGVLR